MVQWFNGDHSHFDNVMTQLIINKRIDAWKTDVNLLIYIESIVLV